MEFEFKDKLHEPIKVGDKVIIYNQVAIVTHMPFADNTFPYFLINIDTGIEVDRYNNLKAIENDVDRKLGNLKVIEL